MSNALLAELDKTPEPVAVEGINGELRGDVYGWPLSVADMVAWRAEVDDEEDQRKINAALIRRGIRHKDGTPWFTDEDVQSLAEDHKNGPLFGDMVQAVLIANRLSKSADEAIAKN